MLFDMKLPRFQVGRTLEDFNVQETSSNIIVRKCPNVTIMHQAITGVSHEDHVR